MLSMSCAVHQRKYRTPTSVTVQSQLTVSDRQTISRGLAPSLSYRRIAKQLDRSVSKGSREVIRYSGRAQYPASIADEAVWDRQKRPKMCYLLTVLELRQFLAEKLSFQRSHEQISGWLKLRFSSERRLYVSHETICRSLHIQAWGVLKKELMQHLRPKRMK
ncbi:hypothetical protein EBB56_11780 [Halomonas sp. YLB-10]|uniref:helix-turn-helix domain-containing protein n=1 Tax=Halomonas sp. YLB-10 TaxID=2483111 RepID=UPI000F5F6317|nr:helix-turn-helix domain-containing protein [Halomonas sp. YLB-10]RQW70847.1 hypothetical protein EBB56_11780 [Halomonas sp. YLB-10]